MGYWTKRLYKGVTTSDLKNALEKAAGEFKGHIFWDREGHGDQYLGIAYENQTYTIHIPYQRIDSRYCERVGEILGCVWLELRMQDNAIWDYTLYRSDQVIDNFSVAPDYWNGEETDEAVMQNSKGQPQLLADVWELPVEQIERYLVHWGYYNDDEDCGFRLKGKAYPADQFEYGDYCQFNDFLRVLDGSYETENHTLVLRQ